MNHIQKNGKILIVDDNEDSAVLLRILLELDGFSVNVALTSAEGIMKATAFVPDVICLDAELEDGSVNRLTEVFRAQIDIGKTRTFGMTAFDENEANQRNFRQVFDEVFFKPVDVAKLVDKLCSS